MRIRKFEKNKTKISAGKKIIEEKESILLERMQRLREDFLLSP